MSDNKKEIAEKALYDISEVVDGELDIARFIANCPEPTNAELRKILAMQATLLTQFGMELILEAKTGSSIRGYSSKLIKLGYESFKISQEAMKTALQFEKTKKQSDPDE